MHQHMPNNDPEIPENATSYRTRMNDLNNNPAIAAYYFKKDGRFSLKSHKAQVQD